jgi:hypothetical protein
MLQGVLIRSEEYALALREIGNLSYLPQVSKSVWCFIRMVSNRRRIGSKKGGCIMRRSVPSLRDLLTMTDEMNRGTYLESSTTEEQEPCQWIERFPKFQGIGRRTYYDQGKVIILRDYFR